jgi:hypothetical protein
LTLPNLCVTAASINTDAVTNAKIANGVDAAKLIGTLPTSVIAAGSIVPAKLEQKYSLLGNQVASPLAAVVFTGIPDWANRVYVYINGLSTLVDTDIIIQLGTASGFEVSGYQSISGITNSVPAASSNQINTGFLISSTVAPNPNLFYGSSTLSRLAGNTWVHSGNLGSTTTARACSSSGAKIISSVLTQVRVTTVGPATTFDAGEISLAYE